MPFCTICGNQVSEAAKFCTSCGNTMSYPGTSAVKQPAQPAPAAGASPLEYEVYGDNLQVARIHLKTGQELFVGAGKMLYKTTAVSWETRIRARP